jgi:hypothetical protein
MNDERILLLQEAARTLHLTQRELAELVGCSLRTIQRVYRGRSTLGRAPIGLLTRAVHPLNPELAATIASHERMTLEECGIAPPPPLPVAAPVVAAVPSAPPKPSPHAADSVLCAAADLLKLPPYAVRPVVMAVFARTRDLGLSVEAVIAALLASEQLEPRAEAPSAAADE